MYSIYLFALSSFLLILDLVIGVLLLGSDELNILSLDLTLGLVFFCFSSSTRPRFLSVLIFINNTNILYIVIVHYTMVKYSIFLKSFYINTVKRRSEVFPWKDNFKYASSNLAHGQRYLANLLLTQ